MRLQTNKNNDKNEFSRREFCKNTAVATGGILASSFPLKSMAHVQENKTLKLAVVGCGGRGSGAVVQALSADDNVELVAMADAFKDRIVSSLKGIQEHFSGIKKIHINEKNFYNCRSRG